ncbi:MAG TPA: quinone-dependent dihydroorotate dehydrogenase [Pedomonas sp.]|uniref:quinone-dependent dihydroorotate dehydrogenase n=1 Tax=Pedomonas sp. TaxID=2976421 RepID=UPI002F3EE02C
MPDLYSLVRPGLQALDAETAHRLTIMGLKTGFVPQAGKDDPILGVSLFGLNFPNPVGLAPGFDKNAEAPDPLLKLGFGFVEVGTFTPRPQVGNPRPRLFRLKEDKAVINRMGFNNDGLDAVKARLEARKGRPGIIGGNVGANKDSEDRIADYVTAIQGILGLVSYITINISSPNTPGLRALQSRESLAELINRCIEARGADKTPMLVKVAPDLVEADVEDIAAVALESGIDGLIVSNTTITRPETLRSAHKAETGGLSGAPLFEASTEMLRRFHAKVGHQMPLIGVGGIASGADAYAKIRAGASLVQLYSSLVYEGPGLVARIKTDLAKLLRRDGFASVQEAVGADAK